MDNGDKNNIEITIQPPRAAAKQYMFPKTEKVADVLKALVSDSELKLSPNGTYYLVFDGERLDPERPLVSYGIEDGARVQISADGGGV